LWAMVVGILFRFFIYFFYAENPNYENKI
jgi:hypothetical protein